MRWNRTLTVVDCHAEGEVGRVVTAGLPPVPGANAFEKRAYIQEHLDDIRRIILFEPRGAIHHNANLLVPPTHPQAHMGFVVAESTEYPAMSGSNAMCVATVLLETGLLLITEPVTELVLETPAGLIRATCACEDGKVTSVRITNQPAFCYALDQTVDVPGVGALTIDVAYGGMTYAMVDVEQVGLELIPRDARALCELGELIKRAAAEQIPVSHPENPHLPGITNTEFTGPLVRDGDGWRSRNTVVVSPGRVDRSPCGTGTSARLAQLHARGLISVGERLVHESIMGSVFASHVVERTRVGGFEAVVPSIAGQAWITGIVQLGMDPSDPFPRGFTVADTWMRQIDYLPPISSAAELDS